MDKALSVLESASKTTNESSVDADEAFGKTVGLQLKNIKDIQSKEFAKIKICELMYKAQFGLLRMQHMPSPTNPIHTMHLPNTTPTTSYSEGYY